MSKTTKEQYFDLGKSLGIDNEALMQLLSLARQVPAEDLKEVEAEEVEVLVGTLTQRWGLNGYIVAEAGHPVYQLRDRYIIYLKHTGKLPDHRVTFYKESLQKIVKFN